MFCVYPGRSNHSTFIFPFFWEPTHQEPWHQCLDGITSCNILTCLWEFSLIYTVTSLQFFIEGKSNMVKNQKSDSLCLFKNDCCEHKRSVSFSLIVWTIAGQILRVPFSLSPQLLQYVSMLWKTSASEQLFSKSRFPRWGGMGCRRPS